MGLELQLYMGILRIPEDPPGRFVALDMQNAPTTDELFDILTEGSRIPLSEVRKHQAGRAYEDPDWVVLPRDPDCQDFLELGNEVMLVRERPHHPAYMHPADMEALGIEAGMLVTITSRRATIHAVVKEPEDLRRGVISMSHGYGIDLETLDASCDPGEPQPCSMGNHTGALASADLDYQEPYSGIPRMSSIPVHVTAGTNPT